MTRIICLLIFSFLFALSMPRIAQTEQTQFSDTFTRGDSSDLGASYTFQTGFIDPLQIVSERVRMSAVDTISAENHNVALANDQWAQVTISTFTGAAINEVYLLLRATDGAATYYRFSARLNDATVSSQIHRRVTGTTTDLLNIGSISWTSGDVIRAEVSGSNLRLYRNGTLVGSFTDSSPLTSGRAGFGGYVETSLANVELDNFSAGDFDWQSIGTLGSTQSKTADQSSLALTTTAACESGNVCICVVAVDNNGTGDGDEGAVTSITDSASNTWSEVIEFANGQGTAQTGAVAYLAYTKATTTIASSGTITANFSNSTSRDASAMTCREYSVRSGYTISSDGTASLATDGADPGAISLSSLTSREYLFLHGLAAEGPNGDAYTWDADYTQFAANGTTGGTDDDMHIRAGFRIFIGTGDTVDVTSTTADRDYAQVMAALLASPATANRRRLTVFGVGP